MRGTELGGMPTWRVGGPNWKACSYSAEATALRQGLGPWNVGRFSMWILWDLAFETLSLYSVATFGRAACGPGKESDRRSDSWSKEEMNVHYGDPCHLLSVRYGTLCVRVLIEHWSSLGRVDVGNGMWWHVEVPGCGGTAAGPGPGIKGQYRLSGCPLRWPCLQRPVVIIDLLPSGQHSQ